MKKVIVLGSPGAGKSTFSRELAEKTGLPLVHLDKLFWKPGWENVSREEFDAAHAEVLGQDKWIIDGNYSRTIPERAAACDTVIWLDYPTSVCLFGAFRRVMKNRGTTRPDMGAGCPERFDAEFFRYIMNFRKKQRPKLQACLSDCKAEIHVFRSRKEAKRYLDGVEKI